VIDIYNQTVTELDLEPTTGWAACLSTSGDRLVWGMVSSEGAGLYLYDHINRRTDKFIATTGAPYAFVEFLDK
jgi:hypothetical protein